MSKDYKNLFGQKEIFLTNTNRQEIAAEIESADYMSDYIDKKKRFIPPVDFSHPKNFARFGSAEKYYLDSIDRIYKTYPYDGSLRERIQWELSSSYLDLHIFENGYPRRNGHIIVSAEGWGSQAALSDGYGAPPTASYEYVSIKGGPNTSTRALGQDIQSTTGDYKSGYSNVWDVSKDRESNLKLGGTDGNTVEFWLKKNEFLGSSLTNREVLLDVHTSANGPSSTNYGRLTIELTASTSGSPFRVTYMSGTAGLSYETIGSGLDTSSVADGTWHHYAFTFKNTGSNVEVKLFVDANCNETITTGTSIDYVSGNLNATIGALATAPSGTTAPTLGWGKMSGSMDEFRFWKTARTSQQIGRFMIEPVGGGSNTDDANTDLGVYYKFNEGITQTASIDEVVLDYSGRISNGTFTGYNSAARNTGSAIVESGKASREFKDPILYSTHPAVVSYRTNKMNIGREYDYTNNSSIYFTLPAYIIEEAETTKENIEYSPLKNLTQIIGSYFDSMANQAWALPKLKHKNYLSASAKPYPFSDRLLESVGFSYFPELFSDATALQQFRNRSDKTIFKQKLYDIKNRIYQNIYNNIIYIYKTKGTEKSFRNLIRCFGVDNEIYKINLYGDRITYRLKDNYEEVAEFKKYANFALTGTQEATVFPAYSSANPDSTSFISSTTGKTNFMALTMEAEAAFPVRYPLADTNTVVTTVQGGPSKNFRAYVPFKTASLFGMHQVNGTTENDLTWATTAGGDKANFQVYAIRDEDYSQRCYFKLSGVGATVMPTLTSSYFDEVFNDTRWTFSVSVRPKIYPEADLPYLTNFNAGYGQDAGFTVEFYGVEKVLDTVKNEFFVTGSMTYADGVAVLNNPKSIYIGAHKENFSGTLQQKSDAGISSTRVWLTHLPTGTIQQHAQDAKNYGVAQPYRSAYLYQTAMSGTRVPEIHTLALNWNFDTMTGSDDSGEFLGQDFSSGSTSLQNRYSWLGDIIGKQYLPKGYNFPTNFSSSINRKYIYSAKKQLPEFVNSSDMVSVMTDDDLYYNKGELLRPTNYYMYIEKSMYQTISEEMVRMFSSIKDFNNLIGEPVNKYRHQYKNMQKLRQLFFERVGNTPDLDKYIDFYKWIDQTLDVMLGYLIPATADIGDQYGSNVRTLVESHVLERNKYKWQYPTLEDKTPDLEGNILGINELLYDWEYGHTPPDPFNSKSIAFNGMTGHSLLAAPAPASDLLFGADGNPANEPKFSLCAWVKPATSLSTNFGVIGHGAFSSTNAGYALDISTAHEVRMSIRDENTNTDNRLLAIENAASLTPGEWNHICATYDGSSAATGITIYVNGESKTTTKTTGVSYSAMHNINSDVTIGRNYSNFTYDSQAEGNIDEVAAFGKELSATEVTELYHSRHAYDLNTFSARASLVSWWRMGDKASGTSPNYTIPDLVGSNDATMTNFSGTIDSGVVDDHAPSVRDQIQKCLWWRQRAERDTPAISSSASGVNSDKQAMLDSINNETNAKNYMLYDSATSTTYSGSTFAIRRLAKPYKFTVDESRTTKGGTNYYPNKKVDIIRTETSLETSTNFLAAAASNVEAFKSCDDELDLLTKRKYSFNALLRSELTTPTDKNYFNAKGALFAPFSMYSSSISGGYYDTIYNDFKPSVDITNLHEDTYGTLYGVPMQGPFTDKYVGGLQSRHIAITVDPDQTGSANRPEGWFLSFNNNVLTMSGPSEGVEGNRPKATRLRDETAKRPVNIRNIQQTTGSTIIGNYTKDYELLMTNGREINNRYFVKNEGISASAVDSQIISGVLDYGRPGAAQSDVDRREVTKNGLTSLARNDYIIVNRFAAPGDPSTMTPAFLDIEAQEYSVYNALPWRNLAAREAEEILYSDHTKQFGYFSDAQNSASYVLAGEPYPGSSGSVNALNYNGTASFHKTNRNAVSTLNLTDTTANFANSKHVNFFGGQHDYLYLSSPSPNFVPDKFTISMWINPAEHTASHQRFGQHGADSVPYTTRWFIGDVNGVGGSWPRIFLYDKSSVSNYSEWSTAANELTTGSWQHLAYVVDTTVSGSTGVGGGGPAKVSIYLNGKAAQMSYGGDGGDGFRAGNITSENGPLSFGTYYSNPSTAATGLNTFSGSMDEVSFWNDALSAANIKEIYEGDSGVYGAGAGPGNLNAHTKKSNLVSWWRMGDGCKLTNGDYCDDITAGATDGIQDVGINSNDNHLAIPSAARNPVSSSVDSLTGGAYYIIEPGPKRNDNWFVQHQIPQADLQYAWITASVISDYNGPALYGFEKPDFSNASLASTDITFASSSDVGSYIFSFDGNRYLGPAKADGTARFLFADFVGLNSSIYDPVTSSQNIMGYPSFFHISNTDFAYKGGLIHGLSTTYQGLPKILNSLILHRQGSHGWPSWKQTRGGDHPIIRSHRKNNRQSFWQRAPLNETFINTGGGIWSPPAKVFDVNSGLSIRTIVSQIEPPLTSKFKPLTHRLKIKTGRPDAPSLQEISVRHTYGNEKKHFTSTRKIKNTIDLNLANFIKVNGSPSTGLKQAPKKLIYNSLNHFILNEDLRKTKANPVDELVHLSMGQTIYPREHYTYLSGTRQRIQFSNQGWWRDDRCFRGQYGGAPDENLCATIYLNRQFASQIGSTPLTQVSKWPLDGRNNYRTGVLSASFGLLKRSLCTGELQWCGGLTHPRGVRSENTYPAALYNRPVPEMTFIGVSGGYAAWSGDTKWETGEQAGVNPFRDSFAEWSEDLKRIGKDFSIIPEFRISEHMDYYINDKNGDFLADNPNLLTLTGSAISSSSEDTFYTVYTNSDFMEHFNVVKDDYKQTAIPTELTLECKALKKFLPYEGFYPVNRTMQIASLFSKSFAPSHANLGASIGQYYSWKTLLPPVIAPGILYNSIKSGIAVDYPINTSSLGESMDIIGSSITTTMDHGDPRLSGTFNHRVPFEAIVSPDLHLAGLKVCDTEPHPTCYVNRTGSYGQSVNPLYTYAINNFLAETPAFFLQNSALSSIRTAPGTINAASKNKLYKMRIICGHSQHRTKEILDSDMPVGLSRSADVPSFEYNPPTITMYNRAFDKSKSSDHGYSASFVGNSGSIMVYGSSFGPPVEAHSTIGVEASFEPYTPPYYNGYSHIELTYDASNFEGSVDVSDVLAQVSQNPTYFRETTRLGYQSSSAGIGAMPLSASLNWNQLVTDENGETSWVIQPKWEAPILDFNSAPITLPVTGSGSVSKGMWHQYGSVPAAESGVFLEVADVPNTLGEAPYGSLKDLLGITDTSSKVKLGKVSDSGRKIWEAVVAIPFTTDTSNNKKYFKIDRRTIDWALDISNGIPYEDAATNESFKPAPSVVKMVEKMQKYVIPPTFNFLEYENIDPFAMVIFEFSTQLSQRDLTNIWQNIPPSMTSIMTGSQATISLNLLKGDSQDQSWKGFDLLNDRASDAAGLLKMDFPSDVRWAVFKVKQKAKTDYYNLTAKQERFSSVLDPVSGRGLSPEKPLSRKKKRLKKARGVPKVIPYYSFNWPYDFCSIVELVKVNSTYTFRPHDQLPDPAAASTLKDLLEKTNVLPTLMVLPTPEQTLSEEKQAAGKLLLGTGLAQQAASALNPVTVPLPAPPNIVNIQGNLDEGGDF